ncbi:MAG: SAM-dependent chlorinase/fluorinase [Deltaproteobacteria bacterium]|nr:SAM-dependent chlorinase/fluorinase [Deltaproteobacteria bacterium]MBW2017968.1 SAM-dependent chlorinase/fluorinase [Deltaproteobacteria bacterium]MBW2303385.1 SAM-dependent chlorinase/fluorinase [Deltaproteobacteria bacterium]
MKPSGIITLTTDFGLSDPYVAMMKGVILSVNPRATVCDITHLVRPGSIFQAASVIHESYPFFPEGTVHVAVVDPGVGGERRPLVIQAAGQFFVGPDNGLFTSIIQDCPDLKAYHLKESRFFLPRVTSTFHGRDIFAPVAAHLSLGVQPDRLGSPLQQPVTIPLPRPRERDGVLYGEIVHVDGFGNCITNISGEVLEGFLGSATPLIEVGHLVIDRLSRTYSEAEEGQPLALVNSSDRLEIAVNLGRASEYLGVARDEIIGSVVQVKRR